MRKKLEMELSRLSEIRGVLEKKEDNLEERKSQIQKRVEDIITKEDQIEGRLKEAEKEEKIIEEPKERRKAERKRWKMEEERRDIEQKRWGLENELKEIERELREINQIIDRENEIQDKLYDMDLEKEEEGLERPPRIERRKREEEREEEKEEEKVEEEEKEEEKVEGEEKEEGEEEEKLKEEKEVHLDPGLSSSNEKEDKARREFLERIEEREKEGDSKKEDISPPEKEESSPPSPEKEGPEPAPKKEEVASSMKEEIAGIGQERDISPEDLKDFPKKPRGSQKMLIKGGAVLGVLLLLFILISGIMSLFSDDPERPVSPDYSILEISHERLENYNYGFNVDYQGPITSFSWVFFSEDEEITTLEGEEVNFSFSSNLAGEEVFLRVTGSNERGEIVDSFDYSFEVEEVKVVFLPIDPEKDSEREFFIFNLEEVKSYLRTRLRDPLGTEIKKIDFIKTEEDPPSKITLREFFSVFDIRVPTERTFEMMEEEFDIFLYRGDEENSFGFVSQVTDDKDLFNYIVLREWENSIINDFSQVISFLGKNPEDIEEEIQTVEYRDYDIRYFPHKPLEEEIRPEDPKVRTLSIKEMSLEEVIMEGEVFLPDERETEAFFIYKKEGEDMWEETEKKIISESGKYEMSLEGLSPGKTYSFRAAINWEEVLFRGEEASFTIPQEKVVISGDVGPDGLRVRSGPSIQHSEIGRVMEGTTWDKLDETDNWYKISFQNQEGWVSRHFSQVEISEGEKPEEVEEEVEMETEIIKEEVDFGIFYSLVNSRLVFSSSLESMKGAIDRLLEAQK